MAGQIKQNIGPRMQRESTWQIMANLRCMSEPSTSSWLTHPTAAKALDVLCIKWKKRGHELKFTSVDCKCLKQNFNFWQCQNRSLLYSVFSARYRAMLDHQFGDHLCCQSSDKGGWCKYKGHPDLIAESRCIHHYRNITIDSKLYKLLKKVWEHFGSETMLEQVFHHFSSQKSKSLHQQVSCFAPKDKHFSSTTSFLVRVALVIIMDLVGYEEAMRMIFKEIGFDVPPITMQYMIRRNEHRKYDRMYHQ